MVSDAKQINTVPVVPLRNIVVYPNMIIPLFIGRKNSIKALEAGITQSDKKILLVAQKDSDVDDPDAKDLYHVGTEVCVLQLLKLPDGTIKVLVEGICRARVVHFFCYKDYLVAEVASFGQVVEQLSSSQQREIEALIRSIISLFGQYVRLDKRIPTELLDSLNNLKEPERLGDTVAAHLNIKMSDKQLLLELEDFSKRLKTLLTLIRKEIDLLKVEKRIRSRVEQQVKKTQREYYLNEQMKAIQKELGGLHDSPNEIERLRQRIAKSGMTKEARDKANAELNKLRMMPAMSSEATVCRNYLDCLLELPWKKESKITINLKKAQELLDEKHYGLGKVKERFIEYLAVQKRVKKIKGSILCLVGPPGVGKTSLGQSIAEATGRQFVRVSLGGVRDEAEIRGHRRTYVGSMPGRIIQKLSKVGVKNPLFMLDEIDKMAMDFRGDPSSALLEVLDPEQNHTFNDHYLEIDYDLSPVMFIATANTLDIPPPLLDRMEIIRISGYSEEEKIHIAKEYLLTKQLMANGLKACELELSQSVICDIIRYYTREAGVRSLEREISKICRKIVKAVLLEPALKSIKVDRRNLESFLGVKRYHYGVADSVNQIGQVTALAWTEVGGELLRIEAASVPGKGKITLTGQLGEVMQESIQAAITVVRSRLKALKVSPKYFETHDIHIHLPEGAIPKDGPSAGIGMCSAVVSLVSKVAVRADIAMTGEITLRGEVLPIGGLKEKLLAALRGGIKEVIIPLENQKDLKEIPDNVKKRLKIHSLHWIEEVLTLALVPKAKKQVKLATKRANVKKTVIKSARKPKKT